MVPMPLASFFAHLSFFSMPSTTVFIGFVFLAVLLDGSVIMLLREHFGNKKKRATENQEVEAQPTSTAKFEDKYRDKVRLLLSRSELSNERKECLKDVYTMEYTTQGNIIMSWDQSRETFTYYADHVIPYRFLEVVARRYVIENDCKELYIDMEEEIAAAEKKKQEAEEKKVAEDLQDTTVTEPKKNVFAKLKSYNRENSIKSATTDLKRAAGGPRATNSVISATNASSTSAPSILKERANRFSYQGRISNFSFLKKVDRRVTDKTYALSFSDFKKMQQQKQS